MSDIHDITKQALTKDSKWVPGEGFIVVWGMDGRHGERSFYVWGPGIEPDCNGDPVTNYGGWDSVIHAKVYPTYAEARAAVPAVMDMPVDVLQELADI
jgi:hypothetical protein